MTKRKALIKQIGQEAAKRGLTFGVVREGGNHTLYGLDGKHIPIPRHTELGEILTRKIKEQAGEKLGKDWWK